jgi:hypothetical protein
MYYEYYYNKILIKLTKQTRWTVSCHIFLSNYWWQRSDIWSQASYRYSISWEAFLNPSDGTYMKLVTKYQISVINSCWEKCDEKCAYMFNVYKNQLSRQTGSRNLMGSKTLPTIWSTYMKLVTKYQISVINSCWEKCDEKCAYMFNVHKNQLKSAIDDRDLIFGHKLHIGTQYHGKRF